MAEIVLSAMLPVLFEKLASAALKNYARYNGIDAEMKKWQRWLTQIQRVLADASRKEVTDEFVKQWLKDLQHLAYDIDDVLDGWLTEAMQSESTHELEGITSKVRKLIIPTCCTNFSGNRRMVAQLDDISTKLQDLIKQKSDLGLIVKEDQSRPRNDNRRLQASVVDPSSIVGRQAQKEALVHELLSPADEPCGENYNIIPILGMGGVGKTTLARLLYDDKHVKDHFELRAWVCVSDEFDSFAISKVIFQSVAGVNNKFEDLNLLQEELVNHLRGKRFLLVLDDVWSESYADWETLVRPFYTCSPGSKIIITTRKDQLLKQLVHKPLNKQLHSLSDDDALSLVARHALEKDNFDSHLSLKPYAEGIVKKCGGLPLALIAIGRLLRTKSEEVDYWKEMSNSEIWRLQDEGGILPALRLSYHDLSATLKQLFAYCSLFPKDFLFDKEELVLLWMAEGFFPSDSPEGRLGHKFFDELLSRSFFQHAPNNETLFVMHDLMNDLATHVASEFYLRLDNESEKNNNMGMLENYRHMSFVREQYVPYTKFEAFERAKSLRTFMATSVGEVKIWSGFYLSSKVLTHLLSELSLLRVLSLSDFQISEVPESIGTLRHLRYLNLSRTAIYDLPENVCNLYNLQSLILFGCYKLTKLPNSFLKLKKLQHLDIRDTPLSFQDVLGIGELKSLQIFLSKIVIKSENGFEIAKLKNFKNLSEKISIVGLEKVQNASHVHEANFSQNRLSELNLVWSDELHDSRNETLEKLVLNELKPCHDKLIQLEIRSYGGFEFPKWVGDPLFLHLKRMTINDCKKCTSLPAVAQLPSLKELFIKGLDAIEVIDSELLESGSPFPSLEILSFKNMKGWKKWSGVVFPCLQKLKIYRCNLVEVTLEALPSLNVLKISSCPNLVEATLGALTSLNVLRIDGTPNLVEATLGALPLLNVLGLYKCDSGVLRSLVEMAPAVTELSIGDILGLNDVVWRGVIEYLGTVEELYIRECNEIRYLWESDAVASKTLVKLRKLEVTECYNLVSLVEKEGDDDCRSNLLTSLIILKVFDCKNMERCSCPDGIEELSVIGCSSIADVSFSKGGQEKLVSFTICNCRKLLERGLGGQKMDIMPKLEYVKISDWPNLKSIIELNGLVHLVQLRIEDCENLESFPDSLTSVKKLRIHNCAKLEVSFVSDNLISLDTLEIIDCPRIDAPFSGGVWPPNLRSLEIGKLKKSISEWGPQNFPTSLVEVNLYGGDEDGASSISQFSNLLPSSLTYLRIEGFENLESFSIGLQHLQHLTFKSCPNLKKVSSHPQHLTSLHHLYFQNCPNMIELPDLLLPSLLRLNVWLNCPKLKERYSKGGRHWPLISHIPFIHIWS